MSMPVCCALLLTALAAGYDFRSRRIPNGLILAGWLLGIGLWLGYRGLRGLGVWLWGALLVGAAGLVVWYLGGIGAGDVKLLSAMGGILSWKRGLWVFFAAACVAALWGSIGILRREGLTGLGRRLRESLQHLLKGDSREVILGGTKLSFGIMLFLGMVLRAGLEWWWLH